MTQDLQLSPQAEHDRRMCMRSLYYLCKEVLGYKDMVPHVHGYLCDFLTNPIHGRFRQSTLPRSWFKSWIATVGLSIWLTLPDDEKLHTDIFPYKGPNVRILIASNVIDNAAKMIHKIKAEWESNDRLKAAFPELIPDYNKIRWSDHAAEVNRTIKSTEATYTAVGAGGSVISQHFEHIIEDDLIYAKKDDFSGQELMPGQEDIDNAIGWHKLSFSLLANPQTGCIFQVGTRWAPRDLVYYTRTYEHSYHCFEIAVTKNAVWPIASDEECFWPERYNKFALELIAQAQGPRIFETQYLNRPRAMEDIVFQKEYIHIHSNLDEFPLGLTYHTIVDLAGWGDGKGLARNAVVTGAIDSKHHMWIARVTCGRYNPTEVIDIYKEHSRQFKSRIHIEEIQYQRAISHFSREEMERTGEWFDQERLPYDGRKDAKNLRIRGIQPVIKMGGLHILGCMTDLLEELELYPHSKTVDILDCMGYLYKVGRHVEVIPPPPPKDPLNFGTILDELELKCRSDVGYPFQLQVRKKNA